MAIAVAMEFLPLNLLGEKAEHDGDVVTVDRARMTVEMKRIFVKYKYMLVFLDKVCRRLEAKSFAWKGTKKCVVLVGSVFLVVMFLKKVRGGERAHELKCIFIFQLSCVQRKYFYFSKYSLAVKK